MNVRPFGPSQAAELVDDHQKRWATAQAVGTLAGFESRRIVGANGVVLYVVGSRTFETLAEVEHWLGAEEHRA